MTTESCGRCGRRNVLAEPVMLRRLVARLAARAGEWDHRLRGPIATACPACGAYALGAETNEPVPFFCMDAGAVLTTEDWDWWNEDPKHCNAEGWPSLGNVPVSEAALRSAIKFARSCAGERLDPSPGSRPDPAGATEVHREVSSWYACEGLASALAAQPGFGATEFEVDLAIGRLAAVARAGTQGAVHSVEKATTDGDMATRDSGPDKARPGAMDEFLEPTRLLAQAALVLLIRVMRRLAVRLGRKDA